MNSLVNIKYDISCLGFLPEEPINTLPQELNCYNGLLQSLNNQDKESFFQILSSIPKYDKDYYDNIVNNLNLNTVKYIYSVFSILTHYYIWSNGVKNVKHSIPSNLGGYWYYSAKKLGLPCVLTHASVDLYNWRLIDNNLEFGLDNIKCINLLTGKLDEEWFYKIMIAIEGVCGHLLEKIYNLKLEDQYVENLMVSISKSLDDSIHIIKRLRENCDPDFFFNELRIYLSGSNKKELFPNGIILENIDTQPLNYTGGSAAQSTLFQVLDALFGVEHVDHGKNFLLEMRDYMPKSHKEFLEEIEKESKLKQFILNSNNAKLTALFNECLAKLEIFRGVHLNIVHQYIYKFIENKDNKKEEKEVEEDKNVNEDKGTGGTDPKEFLGSVIKNVSLTKIKKDDVKMHSANLENECDVYLTSPYLTIPFVLAMSFITLYWLWQN